MSTKLKNTGGGLLLHILTCQALRRPLTNLIVFPVDTGRKLNVHKTFRRRLEDVQDVFWTSYGRWIYVLCLRGESDSLFSKNWNIKPSFRIFSIFLNLLLFWLSQCFINDCNFIITNSSYSPLQNPSRFFKFKPI